MGCLFAPQAFEGSSCGGWTTQTHQVRNGTFGTSRWRISARALYREASEGEVLGGTLRSEPCPWSRCANRILWSDGKRKIPFPTSPSLYLFLRAGGVTKERKRVRGGGDKKNCSSMMKRWSFVTESWVNIKKQLVVQVPSSEEEEEEEEHAGMAGGCEKKKKKREKGKGKEKVRNRSNKELYLLDDDDDEGLKKGRRGGGKG